MALLAITFIGIAIWVQSIFHFSELGTILLLWFIFGGIFGFLNGDK